MIDKWFVNDIYPHRPKVDLTFLLEYAETA